MPSELFPNVGLIIRADLIDLSSSLEKKSFRFFTKGLRKLQAGSIDAWHKYPIKETRRRLHETHLLKNQHSIMDLSHPAFKHQVTWPQQ